MRFLYAAIAAIAWMVLTAGMIGLMLREEEDSSILCSAWLVGCLMYAITVVVMW